MSRSEGTPTQFANALSAIDDMLQFRIIQKGYGLGCSIHEVAGLVEEERREMWDEVHKENVTSFRDELIDIAVAAIYGVASIDAGSFLPWDVDKSSD